MGRPPRSASPSGGSSASRTFQFRRKIGSGAFGEVYLAEMVTPGGFSKLVAVKLLKADYVEDSDVLGRMRDEARMLGHLDHPSIVQAQDLVFLAGRMAVIMEYVPGANLLWLINPKQVEDPLPPAVVLAVIRRVADALDTAFNRPSLLTGQPLRILHRDIKPSNIRLTPDGEVKVLDFGVARAEAMERDAATQNQIIGSLTFVGPEVFLSQPLGPGTDIYALGVTLYESIARQRFGRCGLSVEHHQRFVRERIAELDLSSFGPEAAALSVLLTRMLDFDLNARPSAREVSDTCRHLESCFSGPPLDLWARTMVPRVAATCEADLPGEFVGHRLEEESTQTAFSRLASLDEETSRISASEVPDRRRSPLLLLLLVVPIAIALLAFFAFFAWPERGAPPDAGHALALTPPPELSSLVEEPREEELPVVEAREAPREDPPHDKAPRERAARTATSTTRARDARTTSSGQVTSAPPPAEMSPLVLKVTGPRRAVRNTNLLTTIDTGRAGCEVTVFYKGEAQDAWSRVRLPGSGPTWNWSFAVSAEHRPALLYYVFAQGCGTASHGSASSPVRVAVL